MTEELPKEKRTSIWLILRWTMLCIWFIGLVIELLYESTGYSWRGYVNRDTCRRQMTEIGLALQSYHSTYNSFPPAYVADDQGIPQQSWRVLLLPFLDEKDTYNRYDFNEPWNGPNNSKLADDIESHFRCPDWTTANKNRLNELTNYVAVIGENTAWQGTQPVSLSDIHDGEASTIMLLEIGDSDIHWMEPRDIHFNQLDKPTQKNKLESRHSCNKEWFWEGRVTLIHFLTSNGGSWTIPDEVDMTKLQATLTINKGEDVDPWHDLHCSHSSSSDAYRLLKKVVGDVFIFVLILFALFFGWVNGSLLVAFVGVIGIVICELPIYPPGPSGPGPPSHFPTFFVMLIFMFLGVRIKQIRSRKKQQHEKMIPNS